MDHIVGGGDPFELTHARPLDFGHWAAHKLEQMTRFDLRHGEAVAVGLALDVMYSVARTGLDAAHGRRILDCLEAMGFTLYHAALRDTATLFAGLDEFREHLGGLLTITLLDDFGQPVDVHEIDRDVMTEAIEGLARRGTREPRAYGVEGEEPTARRA
jgi:3-dehydroquinate synthase